MAIAQPIGLRVALASIPPYVGSRVGPPTDLFRVGRLTPGNAHGYLEDLELRHAAQLFYPLPDSLTVLGYNLVGTTVATVTELVSAPLPSSLMPWDRNPSVVVMSGTANYTVATTVALWTHTVPVGRKLLVTSADVALQRVTTATTLGNNAIYLSVAGGAALSLAIGAPDPIATYTRNLSPSGLVLVAGTVVLAQVITHDVGGNISVFANLTGIEFDA